ncbi:MAG TPA: fibronectin type III domain-containing protein, partial [Candidatus Polarisedimenticolaceae bacterium]|nr:fibronectin type III domain-containing protein [Candidatus Polarisedimenticolaceae bacterium]
MDLSTADNPSVAAHVWRTGQAHGATRVTFATATYGSGRVAAIGDSSPADDDTGDPSDSLHPGWDKASGGVANREIHLNASHWLIDAPPDTTAPVITAGPSVTPRDCTAVVTWTTDEPATSTVEYGPTAGYGQFASVPGLTRDHEVPLAALSPGSEIHFRVLSSDGAVNGPAASDDAIFTTTAAAGPLIAAGPSVSGATVTWTTDEPATSVVDYGTTPSYGSQAAGSVGVTHAVPLPGLLPETEYHYRVSSTDTCGHGPTQSADATFTTGPASIDVSGWVLKQFTSSQTFTIPPGTAIPAGGYLVVARDATLAEFQAAHPGLPPGTVYVDSNATGACSTAGCFPQINGDETFELYDAGSVKRDGTTIAMSTTHRAYQRNHPQDAPGSAGSWTIVDESLANPGAGAGSGNGAGVRINEMADAADFTKEYVELYYDAAPSVPDTIAPAAIASLDAVPLSSTTIRLSWIAPGDDANTGTAAAYDVRRSARPITSEADFASAAPLSGEPLPLPAGAAQTFDVTGLTADVGYHFAMKTVDDASNVSPRSNSASAVTAPTGGGGPTVNHLVIAQIRTAGSSDDVVELFNPTSSPISLSGTSVQYLAATGNFGFRINLSTAGSVPARGWYLVAANGYAGTPTRDDSLGTSNMSNSAGHALLVAKTTNVTGCADAAIIDRVGYGATATCPEGGPGHATAVPGAGATVTRKPGDASGNGQDTDVNNADFSAPAAGAFRNSASTPATSPSALGNVRDTLYLSKSGSTAILDWGNASGATGYRVYRNGLLWASPAVSTVSDLEVPSSLFLYLVHATDGTNESAD